MKRWLPHTIKVLAAATPFLAAILLLHAPQIARADGPGDWPMFGHDPAQRGVMQVLGNSNVCIAAAQRDHLDAGSTIGVG
ncbi:MAG: hypothetical protein Q7R39_11590 [Dehalococcoidia bacterium]|nr:hypothetical protein [Dehalococcoidia bacterium]